VEERPRSGDARAKARETCETAQLRNRRHEAQAVQKGKIKLPKREEQLVRCQQTGVARVLLIELLRFPYTKQNNRFSIHSTVSLEQWSKQHAVNPVLVNWFM